MNTVRIGDSKLKRTPVYIEFSGKLLILTTFDFLIEEIEQKVTEQLEWEFEELTIKGELPRKL